MHDGKVLLLPSLTLLSRGGRAGCDAHHGLLRPAVILLGWHSLPGTACDSTLLLHCPSLAAAAG